MAFTAPATSLEGFRVIGRHPGAVLVWILALVVLCAGFGGLGLWVFGDDIELIGQTKNMDDAEVWPFLQKLAGLLAFFIFAFTVVSTVLYNAITRAALGRREGFAFLKLGMDEVRVVAVYLLLCVLAYAAVGLVVGAIVLLCLSDAPLGLRIAGGILLGTAGLAALIWVGVRLSLLLPATVAERRIDFGRAWRLSRGRFWPLLALGLIVAMILLVMQMLIQIAQAAFHMAPMVVAEDFHEMGDLSDLKQLAAAHAPLLALAVVVFSAFEIVYLTIAWSPYARAYRDIAATPGEEAA